MHPFALHSYSLHVLLYLSCERASQASRLGEVLADPSWRPPMPIFFPADGWTRSRTNIRLPGLAADDLWGAERERRKWPNYYEANEKKRIKQSVWRVTIRLTLHRWLLRIIGLQLARHLLTSTAESGSTGQDSSTQDTHRRLAQRTPIELSLSLRHVSALRFLFLPGTLFGQAQSQTGQLRMSHRLQSLDGLPLSVREASCSSFQLVEYFLSFLPNKEQRRACLYWPFMQSVVCVLLRNSETLLTSAEMCWSEYVRCQRRRKQMSDCRQSRTGGTPHSHAPSPEGASYTGQRRSY